MKNDYLVFLAGDVPAYRFQKNGKSWFYADKITRVEGDKVFYNPGKMEATAGNDGCLFKPVNCRLGLVDQRAGTGDKAPTGGHRLADNS
jgi:hypothetical protein